MRALIVTVLWPTPGRPAYGSFVRDQVDALRALGVADIEVEPFEPGGGSPVVYAKAMARLAAKHRGRRPFDVVHAHYGLSAWPALAVPARRRLVTLHGTDLAHPRSRRLTLAVLPRYDVVGLAGTSLREALPERFHAKALALPVGVDLGRFRPLPRAQARARLGLPADEPVLLHPAAPDRAEKRVDRAREVAGDVRLLSLGGVDPTEVPWWVNAANAVLVPSEREGFGLAAVEALACDVPVLATPVGVHAEALAGVDGTLCAPYDAEVWRAAVAPHLQAADPRVRGRARAERWSTRTCAERVAEAWTAAPDRLLASGGAPTSGVIAP